MTECHSKYAISSEVSGIFDTNIQGLIPMGSFIMLQYYITETLYMTVYYIHVYIFIKLSTIIIKYTHTHITAVFF